MAAIVNLPAFNHEEEAFFVEVGIQIADAGFHKVGQLGVIFLAVDGIGKVHFLLAAEAEDAAFDALHPFKGRAAEHGDAGLLGRLDIVCVVFVGASLRDECGTRGEVDRGGEVLGGNIVVVLAFGRVGHEAGRGGVVQAHRGANACSIAVCCCPVC